MRTFLHELTWYAVASVFALAVDAGLLWLLVHFISVGYLAAATFSFVAGATVAYFISVRLAFRNHRLEDRRAEFAGFIALGAPGLAINAGVISLAVESFGLHFMLAKCLAAGTTFGYNFLARRQMLFMRRPRLTEDRGS